MIFDEIDKWCCRCNGILPIYLFGKDKSRKDGLNDRCFECQRIYRRQQYQKNKGTQIRRNRDYYYNLNFKAFQKVGRGKIECKQCGCDAIACLEINHINGGWSKEQREKKINSVNLWLDIVFNRRFIDDDLNILCRPCNSIHYLEHKFGKDWEIKWEKDPQAVIDNNSVVAVAVGIKEVSR
jgi:hypothetical protein